MKTDKQKNHLSIITITAMAPAGWKPRKSTYKFVACTTKITPAIRKKYEEEAIKIVREPLSAQNPDVELKYSASTETHKITACIEIDD